MVVKVKGQASQAQRQEGLQTQTFSRRTVQEAKLTKEVGRADPWTATAGLAWLTTVVSRWTERQAVQTQVAGTVDGWTGGRAGMSCYYCTGCRVHTHTHTVSGIVQYPGRYLPAQPAPARLHTCRGRIQCTGLTDWLTIGWDGRSGQEGRITERRRDQR